MSRRLAPPLAFDPTRSSRSSRAWSTAPARSSILYQRRSPDDPIDADRDSPLRCTQTTPSLLPPVPTPSPAPALSRSTSLSRSFYRPRPAALTPTRRTTPTERAGPADSPHLSHPRRDMIGRIADTDRSRSTATTESLLSRAHPRPRSVQIVEHAPPSPPSLARHRPPRLSHSPACRDYSRRPAPAIDDVPDNPRPRPSTTRDDNGRDPTTGATTRRSRWLPRHRPPRPPVPALSPAPTLSRSHAVPPAPSLNDPRQTTLPAGANRDLDLYTDGTSRLRRLAPRLAFYPALAGKTTRSTPTAPAAPMPHTRPPPPTLSRSRSRALPLSPSLPLALLYRSLCRSAARPSPLSTTPLTLTRRSRSLASAALDLYLDTDRTSRRHRLAQSRTPVGTSLTAASPLPSPSPSSSPSTSPLDQPDPRDRVSRAPPLPPAHPPSIIDPPQTTRSTAIDRPRPATPMHTDDPPSLLPPAPALSPAPTPALSRSLPCSIDHGPLL
ncbi:hypothetical protein FRC08_001124 [Ceratobasidium sp. 394]|nr:hypothetical protein FRC08_001124 [Ceratobasidium sp. 394]